MLVMTIASGYSCCSCWDYRLPIRVTMTTNIRSHHLLPASPPPPTPLPPPPLPRRNAAPWSPSKKTIDLSAFPPYAQDICGKGECHSSIHSSMRQRNCVQPADCAHTSRWSVDVTLKRARGWCATKTHPGDMHKRDALGYVHKTWSRDERQNAPWWCTSKTHLSCWCERWIRCWILVSMDG